MAEVTIPVNSDNAVLLLDAAQQLDLDPSVVQTGLGGFTVPQEVADKAGLSEGGQRKQQDEKAPAKKAAAKAPAKKE